MQLRRLGKNTIYFFIVDQFPEDKQIACFVLSKASGPPVGPRHLPLKEY